MFLRRVRFAIFGLLPLLSMAAPAEALFPAPDALREDGVRLQNNGVGLRDSERAYRLFCLAALEGDSRAAYHLGMIYLNRASRMENKARAAGWFEQAENMGDPDAGGVLQARLESASRSGDPNCPLVKPKPDRKEISTWVHLLAPYYKISPILVLSVIKVESNFNARAKSPKNAFGLMQLMQPTAERFKVKDIWNPFQNIKGGMAYLAWLKEYFRYFKGLERERVRLMLAAYNAGEEAVKRYDGIPPYDETRKYVKQVIRIYTRYISAGKRLHGSSRKYVVNEKTRYGTNTSTMSRNRKYRRSHTPLSSAK